MCYLFIPQEMQEARKSFSKKDEEYILSGRDKRLAEQVSSYNVSQRIKCITFLFFFFTSFNALLIFFSFSCFSFICFYFHLSLFLYICSEIYSCVYIYIHIYMYTHVGFFNASLNIFSSFFFSYIYFFLIYLF